MSHQGDTSLELSDLGEMVEDTQAVRRDLQKSIRELERDLTLHDMANLPRQRSTRGREPSTSPERGPKREQDGAFGTGGLGLPPPGGARPKIPAADRPVAGG